jgi:hypothetical protein
LAMASARMCVAYWSLLHGADSVWKQRFGLGSVSVTLAAVLPHMNCQFGVCFCESWTCLICVCKPLSEHNRNNLRELMFCIGNKCIYKRF